MSPRGAVHNALSRGVLPSALSRAVGDAEGSSGLERYGETLTPTLDLWRQAEWAYLRRETLLGLAFNVSAVAAEYCGGAIVNPDGSNLIVVVDGGGGMVAGAVGQFRLGRSLSTAILATYLALGRGLARDSRWNIGQGAANTAGASLVASGTDAAAFFSGPLSRDHSPADLFCSFPDAFPVILHPGQAVVIECGNVNTAITLRFRWRERLAFPGELE